MSINTIRKDAYMRPSATTSVHQRLVGFNHVHEQPVGFHHRPEIIIQMPSNTIRKDAYSATISDNQRQSEMRGLLISASPAHNPGKYR
jgi:hypothetical protein